VADDTINTMPLSTLEDFLDHGRVPHGDPPERAAADAVVRALLAEGIDVDEVGTALIDEGVTKFEASYQKAVAAVEAKGRALAARR
jgi:transaldolase